MSALEALSAIADPGTVELWELPPAVPPASESYRDELAAAADRSGVDESVVCGAVRIGGVRAAALAWEFAFLGGSVGVATATRLVAAIRRATDEGLALVALPRSGGTRMQEGAPAFVQMVAITAAVAEHRAAGLPYLVHQCGPTTGGVLATLGSGGDITSAEPGAMIGFLGPRAYAAITGQEFPEGIQTAENLLARGIIDAVLPWPEVPARWATLLRLWADRPLRGAADGSGAAAAGGPVGGRAEGRAADGSVPAAGGAQVTGGGPESGRGGGAAGARRRAGGGAGPQTLLGAPESAEDLWRYVEASRAHDRIDAGQFIAAHMTDVVWLPGTAAGEPARGASVGLGRLRGMPVVVAATEDRWTGEPLTAPGLRAIRRGIALAGRWGLPVVTIVDTLGAQLSVAGEQSGIAGEISRVMFDLVSAPVPTAAVLLGAGTGGAALALLAADRIVAGSHTWVAPLAPEGAAAIRHGGTHDPARIAWEQRIGAHSLADLGFIDTVVRESDPDWVAAVAAATVGHLQEVVAGVDPQRRVRRFAAWADPVVAGG